MKKLLTLLLIVSGILWTSMFPVNKPTPLKLRIPEGWPQPYDIFKDNPLTEEGFLLGRKLFYDGRLSKDGKFPCSSCHEQHAAFATFDHDFSHGFGGEFTDRNAPALQNMAWVNLYNWDGAFSTLEAQAVSPITAPNEMAENMDSVVLKIRKDKEYRDMFKKAFGSKEITPDRMLKALAQFSGMLVSSDSKYDRVMRGEDSFNSAEQNGYEIFKLHCEACHKEPLFTDNSFRNNGLKPDPQVPDYGRVKVTDDPADSFKFRVPSLRNLGVTQPFMHDGRFYTIPKSIEHYLSGIYNSPTLDSLLRKPIVLTEREKYNLTQFLYSLTDSVFIQNPAFKP